MAEPYDCIVIGSGPGGYVAAIRAAQLGMKTAVVEVDQIGGRCLNYACIPAKAVLRVADVLGEIREAGAFGITVGEPTVDFDAVGARRQKVVKTLTGGVAGLMKKNAIDVIEGHGVVTDEGNVKVGGNFDGTEYGAKTVILATGSVKRPLPGTQFGGRVIGTEEAWALTELPDDAGRRRRRRVGHRDRLRLRPPGQRRHALRGPGPRPADRGRRHLEDRRARLQEAGHQGPHRRLRQGRRLRRGQRHVHRRGRGRARPSGSSSPPAARPDIENLGLEEAGIALTETGLIAVDGALRTSLAGVYAIGDLVPGPALAHKASDEGIIAVEDAAGLETHPLEHVDIPRATFCLPNVASFGLTEQQARDAGHDVVVGKMGFGAVGAGTVYGDRTGLVKIVGDRRYGELLGGHIVGTKATELIQELVNVRALEGGFGEVARIVHGHPTLSEAVMEAARDADGWLIHG